MSEYICSKCGAPNPIKHTIESFKKAFKVGDIVTAFSTDLKVKITAIGSNRFLATSNMSRDKERVFAMERTGRQWTMAKVDELSGDSG